MIITDPTKLNIPCEPVSSLKEGLLIGRKLNLELDRYNARAKSKIRRGKSSSENIGIGLAAPQIGILKRVCVIRYGTPMVLINPVILSHSQHQIPFSEGCLSFPDKEFDTWRYIWITVQSLNHPEPFTVGPTTPDKMDAGELVRSVVFQHEIAHLDGLLPQDFAREPEDEKAGAGGWKCFD